MNCFVLSFAASSIFISLTLSSLNRRTSVESANVRQNFTVVQCYFHPPISLLLQNALRARVTYLKGSRLISLVVRIPTFRDRTHRRVNRSLRAKKLRGSCVRLLRTVHPVALLEFHQGRTEFRPGSSRFHRHVSDSASQPLAAGRTTLRPR